MEGSIMYGVPASIWGSIDKTTEKTIEINFLSELFASISAHFIVTIIGPSRIQESDLGFDAIMAGLPSGIVLAFQFKKPFLGSDDHPRFTLNVAQLQVLLDRFNRDEAFYVLSPFTTTADFIIAHRKGSFLTETTLVDVHDIPLRRKQTQKSRTIKYIAQNRIEITDPRAYIEVERTRSFEEIISSIMEERIGKRVPVKQEIKKPYEKKKRRYGGPNYYVHVSESSVVDSTSLIFS